MLDWFLSVNTLLRAMYKKVYEAQALLVANNEAAVKVVNSYLKSDLKALRLVWENAGFDPREFGDLGRHIGFGDKNDYDDIIKRDLPAVEDFAEKHARTGNSEQAPLGFENLLHPVIHKSSYQLYRDGHLRDAVLNAVVAVFDLIRKRSDVKLDGQGLVSEVFSLDKPKLIFSELETESGRNDQKGFIQILIGAYIGIRNSKAHSLHHDLDNTKAVQYLVFASLIARRVSEASEP